MRLFAPLLSIFAGLYWLCASDVTDQRPPWDAVKLVSFNRGDASDRSWLAQTPTLGAGATFVQRVMDLSGTATGYATFPDDANLETLPLTVMCWIYIDVYTGSKSIVSKMTLSTSYRGWTMNINPGYLSRGFQFYIADSADVIATAGEYRSSFTTSSALTASTWYHVAATVASTASHPILYINGALASYSTDGNGASMTTVANSESMRVGLNGGPEGGFWSNFDGKIDDLRVYNTVKTAAEIGAIYASTIGDSRP